MTRQVVVAILLEFLEMDFFQLWWLTLGTFCIATLVLIDPLRGVNKSNDAGKSEITNNGTGYCTYLETNILSRPSSKAFLAIDFITLMQPFAELLCTESMLFRIK